MTETEQIIVSGVITFLVVAAGIAAMVLLSRGAGMRQLGRESEGRRSMLTGVVLLIAAMLALPLIDVVWQSGDERRETWRSAVGIVGAAVLFAPIWWRALTNWLRPVDGQKRLVTWSDLVARRALPLTIGCVFVGLSIRAVAVFGM